MSTIGSPLNTSLIQAAQAQDTAGRARSRERVVEDRTQRYQDLLELRAAGLEAAEAARQLPGNDSEQADHERQARPDHRPDKDDEDRPNLDVTA
jgi:hypothetical protein